MAPRLLGYPKEAAAPARLVFASDRQRERELALTVTGAHTNDKGTITFPPEPFAVADLKLRFPELQLDDMVAHWFYTHIETTERALWLSTLEDNTDFQFSPEGALEAKLRPYQRVGAWWLRFVERGILGDEMGMGKTVQALAAVQDCDRVLIVTVPVAEHSVWEKHVESWLHRACWVINGEGKRRQALLREAAKQKRVVIVVNHEMLQSRNMDKYPELWSIKWDAFIVDEAHKLQGRPARKREDGKVTGSQTTKGAEQIQADRVYLLTGTPVWNKPDSLYGLLHVLDPQRFSSYWRFVGEYCEVVQTEWSQEVVGPNPATATRFHNLIAPMLLQRKKAEVLKDLPSKTVQVMDYQLDDTLSDLYWDLKENYRHPATRQPETSIPKAYADMRRLLNAPKLLGLNLPSPKDEMLDDLVEQATGEGKPVVIFTWHNDYTEYLRDRFGGKYVTEAIYGPVGPALRDRILERFQNGFTQVLVASLATMGVAVDLTAARVAIFAEGHYVNTVVQQAEDRLHRIGQTCDVMIYRVQSAGTIEEAIWETADARKHDADEMLALEEVKERVLAQHRRA